MADTEAERKEQVAIAQRLQLAVLKDFEEQMNTKTLSSTDRATLVRLLSHNGWSLDPKQLPQGLRDKLTSHIAPDEFDDDDGVVGKIA